MNKKLAIGFIGAGNIATSIIKSLPPHLKLQVFASTKTVTTAKNISDSFPFIQILNNKSLAQKVDVLFLAIKPNQNQEVLEEIKNELQDDTLIVSVMAGVKLANLVKIVGDDKKIIRIMPNILISTNDGVSGFYANSNCMAPDIKAIQEIFKNTGLLIELDKEEEIDVITAISGSAPAYFFLFSELLIEVAINLGIAREDATKIIQQNALGSALMAKNSDLSLEKLRESVTSKNGTTEAALDKFKQNNLEKVIMEAAGVAYKRAVEISEKY